VNQLLEASLRFPTVIFTIGLGVALIYWLFVLLGALDIDILGGGDAAAGASKGGLEALKGVKGITGGGEHDGIADGHDGGIWETLGIAAVPITVSFSVIMLLGWIISLLGMHHASSAIGDLGGWLAAIMLLVALVVAVVLGGFMVRPLGKVFEGQPGKSNQDYVGYTCTITTGSVDDNFGQATVEDGGTVLVIPVRCDKPGALGRGHKALIIDFDRAREAYLVEPTTDLMARTGEE
jgi:hypothetical protein